VEDKVDPERAEVEEVRDRAPRLGGRRVSQRGGTARPKARSAHLRIRKGGLVAEVELQRGHDLALLDNKTS
jgi:hypothetical protein